MDRKVLPMTVDGLIDHLDDLYPHRCVQPGDTIESAQRAGGQRDVVDYLLQLRAKESNRELEQHKSF